MNIIFVLAVTMFIEKSCSQILSKSPDCFSNKDTLTLNCETTALNETIYFNLNGGNKGGCVPGLGCGSSITQAGTMTSMTILQYNDTEHGGSWSCTFGSSTSPVVIIAKNPCSISQMSTSISTERTTSVNSIFEFRNITIPMITDSLTLTSDISASTTSYVNTGTINLYAHTESTNFYTNTETTNVDVNETNEIQTNTLRIVANSMSIYQSMFVTTAANDISGLFDTTRQKMTTTFALPGYSISSYNEIILPSIFETINVFPQTFSEASISLSLDTLSNNLFNALHFSSGYLITTDSSKYSILSMTISPLMSTTLIDQIPYSSKMEDPSFSSHQYLSESNVILPKISVNSQLPSAIIDTMNHFLYKTNTLITTYLDDTSILFDDLTDGYQTFSQDYAASASMSLDIFYNSTDHDLSLQTTEYYYETMQTEFTSYVTTPLYESHTNNATTGVYSNEIVTSGKSYMHTSVLPSQTQLASMNDIQDSITDFEPYSQSNDEVFSSEISEYLLSTLQSASLFLPLNTKANASGPDPYMKTTNMSTFESQSVILTADMSLFTIQSSIQISTILLDFKTTLLTTTINFNSKTMPSMIQPSSKQTNSGIPYNEIETSFKDSLFFLKSFSDSLTSYDQDMTSLSSGVFESISTFSPNTIQNGLSEKNKTIIFITTTSAIITLIVVILLIILAKVYMSKNIMKPRKEDDNISWSNESIPPKAAFSDYSFTGKSIYPLVNTSSVSFKMFPYEHHWNDIV